MKKRWISLILAVLMLLPLLSVTAWADSYGEYVIFDLSVWEDGVEPVNCNASASGNGWVYDKKAGQLTLDGFDGKFMTIGAPMTVVLKDGSKNQIAYGLHCENAREVTITGSGTLNLGNMLECSFTNLTITGGTVRVEKRSLPSFCPQMTTNEAGDIVTPNISNGKGLNTLYSGVSFYAAFNALKMQGGHLIISGTEYGIWGYMLQENDGGFMNTYELSGGQISIRDAGKAAICMEVRAGDTDALKADPSAVFGGASAVGSRREPLTWEVYIQQVAYRDNPLVMLYDENGEAAKSAYLGADIVIPGDINGDGETTVVEVAALYGHLIGTQTLTESQQKALDMNDDGVLDVYDLQYLYELAAGLR